MASHVPRVWVLTGLLAVACSGSRPGSGTGGGAATGGASGSAGTGGAPGAGGATHTGGVAADAGVDASLDGTTTCPGPNPAERCQSKPDECIPSTCGCSFGVWSCTGDCRSDRLCADAAASDATPDSGGAALCTGTGGTVRTMLCCLGTVDFPNTCAVGACGCAPSSSHDVSACACPGGTCFTQSRGCATPACTPGADQTCNDNPTVSSIRGRCQGDSTCVCNAGGTLNPTTGRCL